MGLLEIRKVGRPLQVLLLGVLLAHLGSYMVTPLLPIVLTSQNGLTLVQVGTILATIAIAFQVGSISGGVLADRMGRRLIIGLGAVITAGGVISMGIFKAYPLLLVSGAVMGIGNGLNAPSTKAAIAAFASTSGNQTTAFSLRGIAANIGTGTSGLIIFFLLNDASKNIFWISGAIYLTLALSSWLLLPAKCGDIPCPGLPIGAYGEALKHKPFVVFSLVTVLIWALYAQFSLALPIRAADVLANPKNISLVWTINSFIVIGTQSMVTSKFIMKMNPVANLGTGIIFITTGITSLFFAHSFIHFIACGAIFVIGEMFLLPTIDSTISQLSKPDLISLFFALSNVVYGLGEAGGKSFGGQLLSLHGSTPYIIYAASGGFIFLIIQVLKNWQPLKASLSRAAGAKNSPQHVPKLRVDPSPNRMHPLGRFEPEIFFRRKPGTN